MFPSSSGAYLATRGSDIFMVRIKGVYPTLQLDKNVLDVGEFLRTGKMKEVPKEALDNITLFHNEWEFTPIRVFNVFSKTEFNPNGTGLYMSEDDAVNIRGKYFRLCQQGVSPMKVIRALEYEFKVPNSQVIDLINGFDAQAPYVD